MQQMINTIERIEWEAKNEITKVTTKVVHQKRSPESGNEWVKIFRQVKINLKSMIRG